MGNFSWDLIKLSREKIVNMLLFWAIGANRCHPNNGEFHSHNWQLTVSKQSDEFNKIRHFATGNSQSWPFIERAKTLQSFLTLCTLDLPVSGVSKNPMIFQWLGVCTFFVYNCEKLSILTASYASGSVGAVERNLETQTPCAIWNVALFIDRYEPLGPRSNHFKGWK